MKSQLANLKGSSPSGTNLPRPQTTGPSSTQKLSAAAASLGQQGTPSGTPGAPGQPPNQGITRFLIVLGDTTAHGIVHRSHGKVHGFDGKPMDPKVYSMGPMVWYMGPMV